MSADRLDGGVPCANTPRVVDYIVEHLAAVGVDHIFGVDGANIGISTTPLSSQTTSPLS